MRATLSLASPQAMARGGKFAIHHTSRPIIIRIQCCPPTSIWIGGCGGCYLRCYPPTSISNGGHGHLTRPSHLLRPPPPTTLHQSHPVASRNSTTRPKGEITLEEEMTRTSAQARPDRSPLPLSHAVAFDGASMHECLRNHVQPADHHHLTNRTEHNRAEQIKTNQNRTESHEWNNKIMVVGGRQDETHTH